METQVLRAAATQGEVRQEAAAGQASAVQSYFPVLLSFAYVVGFAALAEFKAGRFEWTRMMNDFMGGFFVVFSFFKMLDLPGFARTFGSYDVVAKRLPAYGYVYPFIELALGAAYFAAAAPLATNVVNFCLMSVGAVGIVESLLNKRRIPCACLGTVFNLPMSRVAMIENLTMIAMSAVMIAMAAR